MKKLLEFQLEHSQKASLLTLKSEPIEQLEKELNLSHNRMREVHGAPCYMLTGMLYIDKYHRLDNGSIITVKRSNNPHLLPDENREVLTALNAANPRLYPANISFLRLVGIGKGVSVELRPIPYDKIKYIADCYYFGTLLYYRLLKRNLELKKRA